jgi:phage tail tape-measure protein
VHTRLNSVVSEKEGVALAERVDEHVRTTERAGEVSEGGVDGKTGATTGALAGALLGASGGPVGLFAGAMIGGLVGGLAASGAERPYYPEPWLTRKEQLHEEESTTESSQDA